VLRSVTNVEAFTVFVETHELKLRGALTASLGSDVGREAAAEAMAYGWEHWDRVSVMDNPIGYLYRVGRNHGGRMHRRRQVLLPPSQVTREPWVEPGLPAALAGLPERQRVVVWLLHSADWSMSEAADLLEISKSSVQRHAERGLAKLRRTMGVEQ
jgi:RNA polymerase sigma factor (sigma-70 family)